MRRIKVKKKVKPKRVKPVEGPKTVPELCVMELDSLTVGGSIKQIRNIRLCTPDDFGSNKSKIKKNASSPVRGLSSTRVRIPILLPSCSYHRCLLISRFFETDQGSDEVV